MKIRSIAYSESRETVDNRGLKTWYKYGVELEADEHDSSDDLANRAKRYVDTWHKQGKPADAYFTEPVTNTPLPEKNLAHEKIEISIDNCITSLELEQIKSNVPHELSGYYLGKLVALRKKEAEIKDIMDRTDALTQTNNNGKITK